MTSVDQEIQDVIHELSSDIELMSAAARAKLRGDLPKSFDIRGLGAYSNEAWKLGFRRCLAEVRRAIDKSDNEVDV